MAPLDVSLGVLCWGVTGEVDSLGTLSAEGRWGETGEVDSLGTLSVEGGWGETGEVDSWGPFGGDGQGGAWAALGLRI